MSFRKCTKAYENRVCVEFAENAISLPEYEHPQHAFYIFGPEDGTISQEIIDRADAVVYVATIGCIYSL